MELTGQLIGSCFMKSKKFNASPLYAYGMSRHHMISFQVVFTCQINLDIFHLLRGTLLRGSLNLQKHMGHMRDQLRPFTVSHQAVKSNQRLFRHFKDEYLGNL